MAHDDTARTHTVRAPTTSGTAAPSLTITVLDGPDQGAKFELTAARAVIGRSEGCDVRLQDKSVSAFHAELLVIGRAIQLRDLGSRNGTRVGTIDVRDASVPVGTIIQVGSTQLSLDVEAQGTVGISKAMSFGELVGTSRAMREAFAALERLAPTDLSVLLEGETGTGKDLAARALHGNSRRRTGPFITLDCTTIPPGLAESTLFGHAKGAFTGATDRNDGVFVAASGGVLFLDEIGELPLDLQPKLLRAVERREIVPVGQSKARAVDVRFASASWRDLRRLVNEGKFREDLYHRIAQVRVRLPSLAERPDDIKPLVQHFLSVIPWETQAARAIESDALEMLATRTYPGNVRELKYTVERAAMLAGGSVITRFDLAFERRLEMERQRVSPVSPADERGTSPAARAEPLAEFKGAKRSVVDDFERQYLVRLLERAGTNVSLAARIAGLERQSLRELLRKHGLREPE